MTDKLYVWGKKAVHILKDGIALCEVNTARFTSHSFSRPGNKKMCKNCDNINSGRTSKKKKKPNSKKKTFSGNAFYKTFAWAELRYKALKMNDGCCELCGRGKSEGVILNVDHIKSVRRYPELKLNLNNLQVLCGSCNWGKGNKDETDWRSPRLAVLMGEEME